MSERTGRAQSERTQTLFVTRKFPPAVGGMETLSELVHRSLVIRRRVTLVALGRDQRHLVWFLPWAAARTAVVLLGRRTSQVVCGDALTLAALWPVLRLSRVPVGLLVHGLDLTHPNRAYQAWVRRALRRADRVVTISRSTRRLAVACGIPADRVSVVAPGMEAWNGPQGAQARHRREIVAELGLPPDADVLLTMGRLVRRKGVRWFVEEVVPKLPEHVHYVVAGAGPDEEAVRAAVHRVGLGSRVHVLGRVDETTRERLLAGADLFLAPNIRVPDDIEGFGLVVVEAALHGTPVVASRLEGLEDAVADGATGWLCPAEDAGAVLERIAWVLGHDEAGRRRLSERVRAEAEQRFGFPRMADDLVAALRL